MKQPLVSVIVTTRNNHATLKACLESIKQQSYENIELIVVDRDSDDDTKDIARRYTDKVFNKGPERSAQRNYAVSKATGDYVVIIDSDMELAIEVVGECMAQFATNAEIQGVVIPEESFGKGFWAQCKRLERSFYVGVKWMEAARCFPTQTFRKVGGYDETMVSGEDWDLARRAEELGPIGRTKSYIQHNEGHINLWKMLKKKYYYAQQAKAYLAKYQVGPKLTAQVGPIQRYKLFFSQPGKLFNNPLLGLGMLFMKTSEFAAGAFGYMSSTESLQTRK